MSTIKWSELDGQQKEDLIAWLNIHDYDLTTADKRRLCRLVSEDAFRAWDCAKCGNRVYHADLEWARMDWSDFQGAQQDEVDGGKLCEGCYTETRLEILRLADLLGVSIPDLEW